MNPKVYLPTDCSQMMTYVQTDDVVHVCAHTQMGGVGGGMMGGGMPRTSRWDMRICTRGAVRRLGLTDYTSIRLKDAEVLGSR